MLIVEYFVWHYSRGTRGLLIACKNYLKFFWHFFSVGILLATLFFPWKKDVAVSNWRGLHPFLYLEKTFYNIIAILIGAMVRTPVIAVGLIFELLTIVIAVAVFSLWLFSPAIFILSLFLLTKKTISSHIIWIELSAIISLLASSIFLLISANSFNKSKKKNLEEMTLKELSREKWFLRVWNRIGLPKKDRGIRDSFSDMKMTENNLRKLGIEMKDFNEIIDWEIKRIRRLENAKKFWSWENLSAIEPIGKYWHFAYTVELDRYSYGLPRGRTPYSQSYLMGREENIKMSELILMRPSQNNILFVGEPGVGKKTLVNLIARKIKEGKANPSLKYKRLVELELDRVVSDFEGNDLINELHKIFQQAAYAGNIILVIDNIHEFLSQKEELNVDITNTLVQYLAIPTFQVIGISDSQDFHYHLEKNSAVMKYFDKIILDELSLEETKKALYHFLEKEERKRVLVTHQAIEEIIKLSDQFITDTPMPEKAIDVLEETIIYWSQNSSNYFVTREDVDRVFSNKTKIPLGGIGEEEKKKLINLEKTLKERVIGQDEVIRQISEAMRRSRAGISDQNKPIGSFLFLGSTGVGKTETAKALAEAYFGDEGKMIRLDMSEYQTADSVERILGEERTNEPSLFLSKVSENPFSVLLLDEIEKAYPDILNLFLQVLDEGWLTDAFGKKVIFKNMIIIATSNVGSEIIKEGIESGQSSEKIHKQVIDYAISKGIFRPEFLNRFESVLFFRNLEGEKLVKVTLLILENVAKRIYKNKNIKIKFDEAVANKIIEKGYDPTFGARSIKRFVQDKVEDVLAEKIISQEISEGGEIELTSESV